MRTFFLGKEKHVLDLTAQRLLEKFGNHSSGGLTDLEGVIVCLPGSLARKNLQWKLADLSPKGFLSPDFMTPSVLLHFGTGWEKKQVPSPMMNEILWFSAVKKALNEREFPILFHNKMEEGAVSLAAERITELRNELVSCGLSIHDVADKHGEQFPDPERWNELERLETYYLNELKLHNLTDKLEYDKNALENVSRFEEYRKIILVAMPDLPILLKKRLAIINESFPDLIEIWIYDSIQNECDYDKWGAAIPNRWDNKTMEFPCRWNEKEQHNHYTYQLVSTPNDAAMFVGQLLGKEKPDENFDLNHTAIVLTDNSMLPAFQNVFSRIKATDGFPMKVQTMQGVCMRELRLIQLLRALRDVLLHPNRYIYAEALLRQKDYLRYCARTCENEENTLLGIYDWCNSEYFPDKTSYLLKRIEKYEEDNPLGEKAIAGKILKKLHEHESDFEVKTLSEFLTSFLTEIYKNIPNAEDEEMKGIAFSAEIEVFLESIRELEEVQNMNGDSKEEKLRVFDIFLKKLSETMLPMEEDEHTIITTGCLEIPFLTQEHVVICGMNAGWFPDEILPTPFLNDGVRQKLGLRSNLDTHARAKCHLDYLMNGCMRMERTVHFVVLRQNAEKENVKPSSLFFAGIENLPNSKYLERVKGLFDEEISYEIQENESSEKKQFHINPTLGFKGIDTPVLSVTDFKVYLENPLYFFLERVKNMNKTDYQAMEMQEKQFGTICHEILQKAAHALNDSAEDNRTQLLRMMNIIYKLHYGDSLPSLLKLQKTIMEQRLSAAAKVFEEEYNAGFRVPEISLRNGSPHQLLEYTLGGQNFGGQNGIEFEGAVIRGKIDRIEYNEEKNVLRIIDYKTGGKASDPKKSHIKDRTQKFIDLQLPLYVILLKKDTCFQEKLKTFCKDTENMKYECGYFSIPAQVSDTKITIWDYEDFHRICPLAEKTAKTIIREISNLKKQLLAEDASQSVQFDHFADIFHNGIAETLNGSEIRWYAGEQEEEEVKND